MEYSKFDDEAILRLIAQADSAALGELYDRYGRLVHSLALRNLGDTETAQEVTQDVFLRVWQKAETYRADQARVSTWLSSITRYRAIDLLRQRGVRPEGHSVGWEDLPLGGMPAAETDDPEDSAAQSIQNRRVRAAIASLPPDQRQALALAYFNGLSHSEIAFALGEPLGTVKTRIRMAMQKLKNLLQEEEWIT